MMLLTSACQQAALLHDTLCKCRQHLSLLPPSLLTQTYHDLNKVDGLHKPWGSGEHTGVDHTASSWDDLATTTMNGICVKCHVLDVESCTTHVLLAQHTLEQTEE